MGTYKPPRASGRLITVGATAVGVIQGALLLGALIAETGKHPPYKYARRALAAWLSSEQWKRHQKPLFHSHQWRPHARGLLAAGLLRETIQHTEAGAPIPAIELTEAGRAIAECIRQVCAPPLSGREFHEFLTRHKAPERIA